jgi:hypothetical protein
MTIGLSSCANFSADNLFSNYSATNRELHQAIEQGDYRQAKEVLPDDSQSNILSNLERGRVYLLNRDLQKSRLYFEQGDKAVEQQQNQAVISLSQESISLGALAVNDNLTEYVPADYELGFLHLYLALTYFKERQLDDALVELRRANQVQKKAKEQREEELLSDQKRLEKRGIQPNIGSILANYPDAGKTLKAVQNGYIFYLSALLYEASGDLNDAYVDYRRALSVAPNNASVIDGTIRCAQKLGMRQDLQLLRKKYGTPKRMMKRQGRIILIQEQGVVDTLQGWQQSLPVFNDHGQFGLYSLALPYYPDYLPPQAKSVRLDGQLVDSDLLSDTNLMARRQLRERLPTIIFRQILRLVLKNAMRKGVSKNHQDVVNLVMNAWNTLTEQPDTRSWTTLPASVFSSMKFVTAGRQTLSVGRQTYTFDVPVQGTTLVWLSYQGDNAVIWHRQLGRL